MTGGYVPFRADTRSAPTCKLETLKPLMSFTPSASFAQTVTFASLVRRGRLYVGPVFPINTRSFETSRQIVTISGGHMPLRADTRHYGRTQGPPLRTYLVPWRHLFHGGRTRGPPLRALYISLWADICHFGPTQGRPLRTYLVPWRHLFHFGRTRGPPLLELHIR